MVAMKTYRFRAEIERDVDGWLIRCPTMERYGGFAGGDTKDEAWSLIQEILQANIKTMLELGIPVPEESEYPGQLDENQAFIAVQPKPEPLSEKGYLPKTYKFQVVVESDEGYWLACCPTLEEKGAATWGKSYEEAYINIHQVLRMTIESMISHGEPIPDEAPAPSADTIAVTL